jgi:trehalose 6-phosphate phosphatase
MPSWSDLQRDPQRTGVFLDFDGTLSSIVVDPERARPVEGAVNVLHRLAQRFKSVAVVSGRPVAFLIEHLQLDDSPVRAYGLYGLECSVGGERNAHVEAVTWSDEIEAAAQSAEAAAPEGVNVERKGLTVALHVRPAPEHDDWARRFAESEAAARGLTLDRGRLSYELRPPVDVNKGTVVGELIADLDAAAFIGDDRGDLLAFDALDRFAGDGGTALKVAVRSDEAPPELIERADLIVDGPPAVVAALRALTVSG